MSVSRVQEWAPCLPCSATSIAIGGRLPTYHIPLPLCRILAASRLGIHLSACSVLAGHRPVPVGTSCCTPASAIWQSEEIGFLKRLSSDPYKPPTVRQGFCLVHLTHAWSWTVPSLSVAGQYEIADQDSVKTRTPIPAMHRSVEAIVHCSRAIQC